MVKSYSFWELLQNYEVKIPIIQRDYAQGRQGKEFIREKFLEYIYSALERKKPIKLDFIYGYKDNNVFYPLDGQQRITTLWLIHLYIAWRTDKLKDNIRYFKKFSYQTRISSEEFCHKLCDELPNIRLKEGETLSDNIIGQNWFYSNWKQDPTIVSMLRMFDGEPFDSFSKAKDKKDGISKIFKNDDGEQLEKFWQALIEDRIVTFDYLDIENSQLSISSADELYIKMNARGKLLTDFENFKADFIDYYKKEEMNLPKLLDNKWLDTVWELYKDKKFIKNIETAYFSIINRLFFNALCKQKNPTKSRHWDYFYQDCIKEKENFYDDFSHYRNIYEEKTIIEIIDLILEEFKEHREDIDKTLDALNYSDDDDSSESSNSFLPELNENNEIRKIEQKERIVFFAICEYFIKMKKDKRTWDLKVFEDFIRVVTNLKENGGVHSDEAMIYCIRLVNELLEFLNFESRKSFYESLAKFGKKFAQSHSLLHQQLDEEIEKAEYISGFNDVDNKLNQILDAEKTSFLKGSIQFLYIDDKGNINRDYFEKKLEFVKKNFNGGMVDINATVDFLKHFDNFRPYERLFQVRGVERRDYGWKMNTLKAVNHYKRELHFWLLGENEYEEEGFYKNPIYEQFIKSEIPYQLISLYKVESLMYHFHSVRGDKNDDFEIQKYYKKRMGVVLTKKRIEMSKIFENFLTTNNITRDHIGYSNEIIYSKNFDINIPFKYKNQDYYRGRDNMIYKGNIDDVNPVQFEFNNASDLEKLN